MPPPEPPDFDDLFRDAGSEFQRLVEPYRDEFHWLPETAYNGVFEALDTECYYAVLRRLRPRWIIEIGSGYSTRIALESIGRNGSGRLVCIDPRPRLPLPCCPELEHIPLRVEEADEGLFERLCPGDVLFVDSSHTRAEALFHTQRILPRLARGVWVHHHDIMYPAAGFSEEESVVLDFYRGHRGSFRVLFGNSYLRHRLMHVVQGAIPYFQGSPPSTGTSLWAVRGGEKG